MDDEIPGFRGWYDRGYIPHFDDGRPTMITSRLADSLPVHVVEELAETSKSERGPWVEKYLDAGYGACWLERPENAAIVAENLRYHDGSKYRLVEWVVMPNHVHVLYDRPQVTQDEITYSWRSYTAKKILDNLEADETPENRRIWQRGPFDRAMRDEAHYFRCRSYILLNPVKAGLVDSPLDWEWSSAHGYEEKGLLEDLREWYRRWKDRFWEGPEPPGG